MCLGGSSLVASLSVIDGFPVGLFSRLVFDRACVLLIIIRISGDEVVRLAPSRVGVLTVSLLGPLVVALLTSGGSSTGRGGSVDHAVSGTVASTVAGAIAVAIATVATGGLAVADGSLSLAVSTVVIVVG